MNSLSRVADLSAKISRAKLVIDRPAYLLWREKQPLVRKLKVSDNEWIVMATNPWQKETDETSINVNCGGRLVKLKISGQHTEIYHLQAGHLKRILTPSS